MRRTWPLQVECCFLLSSSVAAAAVLLEELHEILDSQPLALAHGPSGQGVLCHSSLHFLWQIAGVVHNPSCVFFFSSQTGGGVGEGGGVRRGGSSATWPVSGILTSAGSTRFPSPPLLSLMYSPRQRDNKTHPTTETVWHICTILFKFGAAETPTDPRTTAASAACSFMGDFFSLHLRPFVRGARPFSWPRADRFSRSEL